MKVGWVCMVLTLLLMAGSTLAVFEDEVGVIDWTQKNLGQYTDAQFSSRSQHLYVVSNQGAVACLNRTTGSIAWRQILPNNEIPTHIQLLPSEKGLLTLSQNGLRVFLWRADDGALRWETSLQQSKQESVMIIEPQIVVLHGQIAILNEQGLFLLSLVTGEVIWNAVKPPSGTIVAVTRTSDEFQVILRNSGRLDAYQWDIEAGGFHLLASSDRISSGALKVRASSSWVVLGSSSQLCVYHSQKPSFQCQSLSGFTLPSPPELAVSEHTPENVMIALWSPEEKTQKLFSLASASLRPVTSTGESSVFLAGNGDPAKAVGVNELHVYRGSSTPVRVSLTSLRPGAQGNVQMVWTNPKMQQVLLQHEDLSVSLVDMATGALLWQRQEALAQVHLAEFVEVPSLRSAEEEAVNEQQWSVFKLFYHRLHGQFNAVKRLLNDVVDTSDAGPLTADRFGFHKLVILATRANKVLCLSTQVAYREPVWGLYMPGETIEEMRLTRLSSVKGRTLFVVRTTAADGQTVMYTIDPFDGSVRSREELVYSVRHSMFLPQRTAQGQRVLIQFDAKNEAHPFPLTEETVELASVYANRTFDVQVERSTRLEGFGLRVQPGSISLEGRWSIALRSGETVMEVVSTSSPFVFSPVRLVSDESPLPKYLTPTLIAVGTKGREGMGIYLIDSVSGHVIHHTIHPDGAGPLHMVLVENFLVYSYWNKKSYRTEVSVIELYEKELDWDSTTFSAWTAEAPQVYQQSFVLPLSMSVSAIGVTQTRQGITTYNILLGTSTGQLIAVDKRWLDGLRQKNAPIPGVLPYRPEVPVSINSYLSHLEQVPNLSHIATASTHMESTSMVLAWGLDQFFTHVQPAAKFDMMSQDFDSFSLVVTASLLFVLTLVTRTLDHRRKLASQWK